ncbi:ribonuclease P protein component [Spongiivirga citrea]|uniref:Ribonuclease P protein component n=1 Tax=Spongiivirga citrea TaxID=1481457 RepID=A0A6M0CK89_9FLAO|nr:ribonuclease P protein component [Spongiivirga citrea]NER17383.1 ribonuclease P protein component [Spongiivirga citrea]
MNQKYPHKEKLKSRKLIEKIFAEGKSVSQFPLKMVYLPVELNSDSPLQVGVSAPKRKFKNAVTRNRIKRLMRESYRLNKHLIFNNLPTSYACMILYIGKEEPDFGALQITTQKLFTKFLEKEKSDQPG